jgi:hypothetical protein
MKRLCIITPTNGGKIIANFNDLSVNERSHNFSLKIGNTILSNPAFEAFAPKEGMSQTVWDGGCTQPIHFVTLNRVTKIIPPPFNNHYDHRYYGGNFSKVEDIISSEYLFIYYEQEKPATERDKFYFNLVSTPCKKGKLLVNGISISYETPNGMTVRGTRFGMIINGEIYRRWEDKEWEEILERVSYINQMRHTHPKNTHKIQYFKKGLIGVNIPDGSLILNSNILTPSGNIYEFVSYGSGRSFGYNCEFLKVAEPSEVSNYYKYGESVKGRTVIDRVFGVTNNTPETIS